MSVAGENETPKGQMAEAYVQKHRIPELFENMTAALIHAQPENAKKFMLHYLETLKKYKDERGDYPAMFTDSNISSVFGLLDVTNKGYITLDQYRAALKTLGVKKYNAAPEGSDKDQISLDTFLTEAETAPLTSVMGSHPFSKIETFPQ